jgi:hypothetical protein
LTKAIAFGLMLIAAAFLTRGYVQQVGADGWNKECRGYSPAKTVTCAAVKQDPPGGVHFALSVWRCESNFGTEPPHSDSYHGPMQYAIGTYAGQRASMPDVTRWFELSRLVHDVRSNIVTAIAWAHRHGWGPWSCA